LPSLHAKLGIPIPEPEVVMYAVEKESVCSLVNSVIHAEKKNLAKEVTQAVADGNPAFPGLKWSRWPVRDELDWRREKFLEEGKPNLGNTEKFESSQYGTVRQARAKPGNVGTHNGELVVQSGVEEAFRRQNVKKRLLDSHRGHLRTRFLPLVVSISSSAFLKTLRRMIFLIFCGTSNQRNISP
jgi:hypothetical protein